MPKIVDRQEKKEEILDAAIRVFAKKGVDGAKIQDIADEAGIGKGTIYLYFTNKQEIIRSVLHQMVTSKQELARSVLESGAPPRDKLEAIVSDMISDLENSPHPPEIHLEILTTVLKSGNRWKLGEEVGRIRSILGQLLKDIQRGDGGNYDPGALASGLLCLIHGGMILRIIDKEKFPLRDIMEKSLSVLLDALEGRRS